MEQLKLDQQCSKNFRALHRLKHLETTMRDPDTRELGRQNTRSESRRQLQWLCATLDVLALELIDAAATDLASHRLVERLLGAVKSCGVPRSVP